MIFASEIELPIGEIINLPENGYITDNEGNEHPPQPFFTIRKATRDEYLTQYISDRALLLADPKKFPYYYEISLD